MTEAVTLVAEARELTGTGASRELRRNGKVPITIYGNGQKPVSLSVEEKEITKYYRKPQYLSQVFELEVAGKKIKVLPKAIELHPVTEIVRHADFVFLDKKEQKMEVPMVYKNKETCVGVKRGGYFNIVKRTLKISCPVANLPRAIIIDTDEFPIGFSLKAKEAILPEGATLLENPEFVIASIIGKKGKSMEEGDSSSEEGAEGAAEESEKPAEAA